LRTYNLKLKKLISRYVAAQGFEVKYKKLKRKKWWFLKEKRYVSYFFSALNSFTKNRRNRVKASFLSKKVLIRQSKYLLSLKRTKLLKTLLKKLTAFTKKGNFNRTLKLANILDRRLVVLLVRCGFFNRLRTALAVIRTGHVFVNNMKITKPFFNVPLGVTVHLEGLARTFSLKFGIYQMLSKISKTSSRMFFRRVHPLASEFHVETRLRLKNLIQGLVEEFYLFQKMKKLDKFRRSRISSRFLNSYNPIVEPNLIVDYISMSLVVKGPLTPHSLKTGFKLLPSKLWKI